MMPICLPVLQDEDMLWESMDSKELQSELVEVLKNQDPLQEGDSRLAQVGLRQ